MSADEHVRVSTALVVIGDGSDGKAASMVAPILCCFLAARTSAVRRKLMGSNGSMGARMRKVVTIVCATVASFAHMLNSKCSVVLELVRGADADSGESTASDVIFGRFTAAFVP